MGVDPSLQQHDKYTVFLLHRIRFCKGIQLNRLIWMDKYGNDLSPSKQKLKYEVLSPGSLSFKPFLSDPCRRVYVRLVRSHPVPSNANAAPHIYFADRPQPSGHTYASMPSPHLVSGSSLGLYQACMLDDSGCK